MPWGLGIWVAEDRRARKLHKPKWRPLMGGGWQIISPCQSNGPMYLCLYGNVHNVAMLIGISETGLVYVGLCVSVSVCVCVSLWAHKWILEGIVGERRDTHQGVHHYTMGSAVMTCPFHRLMTPSSPFLSLCLGWSASLVAINFPLGHSLTFLQP